MPIVDGNYVSPTWVNGQAPAINAQELNALCGTVQQNQSDIQTLNNTVYITRTASGNPATFSDGANNLPIISLVATISPLQSGSGDPSPTNVRPISGWTGATVTRTGKNLCSLSDVTFVQFIEKEIEPIPSGTHVFSAVVSSTDTDGDTCAVAFLDENKTTLASKTISRSVNGVRVSTLSFSTSVPIKYVRLYAAPGYPSGAGDTATFANIQIELGSTATAYEPYHEETSYFITFPSAAGTVYGGTLDVTNGVLTVDLAVHEFTPDDVVSTITDLSDATISPLTRVDYFKSQNPSFPVAAAIATEPQTRGKYSHGTYVGDNGGYTSRTYHGYAAADAYHIFIPCAAAGDKVAEYLYDQQENGTPVQLCFPLAEPLTYQLTPHEVNTLLGANTIYTGSAFPVTVTYKGDPSLVVQALEQRITKTQSIIAGVEASTTASKNYSIGNLLIQGDKLYKVTSAIANGAEIIVGTNVAETTVAEQLLLLA